MGIEIIISTLVLGAIGFIGWLIRSRFSMLDDLDRRVNTLEVKFDILGDIVNTLHEVKTDIAVIKTKLESTS